jgi:hypothetical protein
MTTKLSQGELLRKKLAKRQEQQVALANNITPKALAKTPSQSRSERLKKKLSRGVKTEVAIINDCFDCPKKSGCAETLVTCPERSVVRRCMQCGSKIRHYATSGKMWERCETCRPRQP